MQLQVQQQVTVDGQLEVGAVETAVSVVDEVPRLQTVDATLGRVINNKEINDLSLPSRDVLQLVFLTPGVVGIQQDTGALGGSLGYTGTNFSSNGTRNSTSDVLVDGVSQTTVEQNGGITHVMYKPSTEAIQEFKVQTNSFSAEFGNTGGTVVNMVTKSGTNQLKGSLFEFHRNSVLNAKDWFSNRAGRPKIPGRANEFGGSLGGPVVLPRVYDGRNRTFFFFNYLGGRTAAQTTLSGTVPTPTERQGDFSNTRDAAGRLMTIYNPFTVRRVGSSWVRDPFAGNSVPKDLMNPVALNVVKYYPAPNTQGAPFTNVNNLFNSGTNRATSDQWDLTTDHNISDRNKLSVRYSRWLLSGDVDDLWGNEGNSIGSVARGEKAMHSATNNVAMNYTATINPTTVLSLRYGVLRDSLGSIGWTDHYDTSKLGFQGNIGSFFFPRFSPAGYTTVGSNPSARSRRGQDLNHITAGLTKVLGRHSIKAGMSVRLNRLNYAQPGVPQASFSFSRQTTSNDPLVSNSLEGNGLAAMLLGWGSSGSESIDQEAASASQSLGAYINNDWRVTRKLTVNLGLRYDIDFPRTERFNRYSWIDLNALSPITVPGFPQLRGGLQFADKNRRSPFDQDTNNFGPRVGFAYQVMKDMVVRGGYGIYYTPNAGLVQGKVGQGFTTSTSWLPSLDSGVTMNASLTNPFPNGLNAPPGNSQGLASYIGYSLSAPIPNWAISPYVQQFSLSIERALPWTMVAEVAYSGSHGVHLYYGSLPALDNTAFSYNSLGNSLYDTVANPFYGIITDANSSLSRATVQRYQLLRPYPQFTGVGGTFGPPRANSLYHSAEFKLTKRFSHGLQFTSFYTFSKSIDDNSYNAGNVSWLGGSTGVQNYEALRLERAVSVFDVHQRMVTNLGYELPVGRNRQWGKSMNRWLDTLAGGWQLNGTVTLQQGFPLAPTLSGGQLVFGSQRPNLLRNPELEGRVQDRMNRYLDPDAFSRPAPFVMGNAPRTLSMVRTPGIRNIDLSIFKNIPVSSDGARYLQLGFESFNAFNTPRFQGPDATWGSTTFGVVSALSNTPRSMQIAAKFYF